MDGEVAVDRQHMIDSQPSGHFRHGCVGQIERQVGVALAGLEHVAQRSVLGDVEQQTASLDPAQKIQCRGVPHPPGQHRAHFSVITGQVVTSFVVGFARNQEIAAACQSSRALNRAIKGPLSTSARTGATTSVSRTSLTARRRRRRSITAGVVPDRHDAPQRRPHRGTCDPPRAYRALRTARTDPRRARTRIFPARRSAPDQAAIASRMTTLVNSTRWPLPTRTSPSAEAR